jgi:hypothetical protein
LCRTPEAAVVKSGVELKAFIVPHPRKGRYLDIINSVELNTLIDGRKMPYDLKSIEDFCRSEGLHCERTSSEEILVRIDSDVGLRITNAESEADIYFGLSDRTWHTHGDAVFMTGLDTYIELGPIEILAGLKNGDLLIGSRCLHGELQDRWIFHRQERQDFQHVEAGEVISIRRVNPADTDNPGASPRRV